MQEKLEKEWDLYFADGRQFSSMIFAVGLISSFLKWLMELCLSMHLLTKVVQLMHIPKPEKKGQKKGGPLSDVGTFSESSVAGNSSGSRDCTVS
jgi:hypothetical protein